MTNYSNNPGHVRVEFFKPGGKWYMTEEWDMTDYYDTQPTPINAVMQMLSDSMRGRNLLKRFIVVVLDPYHAQAYPVCLVPGMEGHE